jgi:acetyltransferase-like isoleucine patch superfamily enzyme
MRCTIKRFLAEKLYYYRFQQKTKRNRALWFNEQNNKKSVIDLSTKFTGRTSPYEFLRMGGRCILEQEITIWISDDEDSNPHLTLGDRIFIGRNTYLGIHQPICIGENSIVGAYCYIVSANHRYDNRDLPIRDQGFIGAPITIEDDVWIGTHVVILPGTKIGKGAIVAAGSIVNKNIPNYEIWGGTPAKFIKSRP